MVPPQQTFNESVFIKHTHWSDAIQPSDSLCSHTHTHTNTQEAVSFFRDLYQRKLSLATVLLGAIAHTHTHIHTPSTHTHTHSLPSTSGYAKEAAEKKHKIGKRLEQMGTRVFQAPGRRQRWKIVLDRIFRRGPRLPRGPQACFCEHENYGVLQRMGPATALENQNISAGFSRDRVARGAQGDNGI